jgi:Trichodiene synthase (TRI5)
MAAKILKTDYQELVSKMIREIPFTQNVTYDLTIEQDIAKHFESQGFSPKYISKAAPIIKTGAMIAAFSYPFLPKRARFLIGLYTACGITIEDRTREIIEDLKNFGTRFFHSQPQPNRLLQCWVDCIAEIGKFWGPVGRDSIMKASLEFVDACILEYAYHDRIKFSTSAPNFPNYLRKKSGIGEAFAFFLFPQAKYPEDSYLALYLPAIYYLDLFACYANDIFSFYKESMISDEPLTFISSYSQANNITTLEALQQVYAFTVESLQKIRQIVSVDPRLQEDVEQFLQGYAFFHITEARYRLSELGILGADVATTYILP